MFLNTTSLFLIISPPPLSLSLSLSKFTFRSQFLFFFLHKVSNIHVATLDILNSKSKHLSLSLCDIFLTFSTRVRIHLGVISSNLGIKSLRLLHIQGRLLGLPSTFFF